MTVNEYCRIYRKKFNRSLESIAFNTTHAKTLSAFEHGRSSNMNHIRHYKLIAIEQGDMDNFIKGLGEII